MMPRHLPREQRYDPDRMCRANLGGFGEHPVFATELHDLVELVQRVLYGRVVAIIRQPQIVIAYCALVRGL
jgi:hypothetical protein